MARNVCFWPKLDATPHNGYLTTCHGQKILKWVENLLEGLLINLVSVVLEIVFLGLTKGTAFSTLRKIYSDAGDDIAGKFI